MFTALLLLMLIPASQPLAADEPDFTIQAARTDSAPVIDGTVDEAEWQSAAPATDFIQYEPRRGEPSTVPAEALVLYDDTHIHVAFSIRDPEPPVAQLTRRDAQLLNDDAVVLILDTHIDKQSACYFMTNLLGTQTEAGWPTTGGRWTTPGMRRGTRPRNSWTTGGRSRWRSPSSR